MQNLKKEEDPLWDEPKSNFLGYSFYKLEPLVYLMNNLTTTSIISPNGEQVGNLTIDVIPFNEDDAEFDEVPDSPEELIGQQINYKVYIKEAKGLPEHFCSHVFVEYQCFHDNVVNKTKTVSFEAKTLVCREGCESCLGRKFYPPHRVCD